MKSKDENVAKPSGREWLQTLKKGLQVLGNVAAVVLAAPIRLPGKLLDVAKYLALLAGIIKATTKEGDENADE